MAGLDYWDSYLRLKGDYLAIATLGFGEIVRIVFLNIDYVGGASGMTVSHLTTWPWLVACVVITIIVIANFTNSPHGRACISIRENEIAPMRWGLIQPFIRLQHLQLGPFLLELPVHFMRITFISFNRTNFGFLKSFDILIFVVLGGLGSMSGAVIAAILLTIISTYLSSYPESRMVIYSLVLIAMMLFRPQGLLGTREITSFFKAGKTAKGGVQNENK